MKEFKQNTVTKNFTKALNLLKSEGILESYLQFANNIRYSAQSLSQILKGKRDVTIDVLKRVSKAYNMNISLLFEDNPEISLESILYYSSTEISKSTEIVVTKIDDNLDDNMTTNEKYRKCRQLNSENLSLKEVSVPYYDITASAGLDFFFNDLPEVPEDYIKLPYELHNCIAIPIHGESMLPEYHSGDIVIIREITDKLIIEWGTAHIVITDEQRLFKIINKGVNGAVVLRSINQEYDPIEMPGDKIRKLFKVEAAISKKTI